MDLTHRIRISLAAAIALCAAGSIALASSVEAGPPVRMPDLQTIKPFGKWLLLGATDGGRPVLHIANTIVNAGDGPLDLFAGEASESCEEAGQEEAGSDFEAEQQIYQDDGGGGLEPSSVQTVGCFEYHPKPGHEHWHFQDFSQYKLEEMGTSELVAGPSRKIGFCILDGNQALPNLPGSPARTFNGSGCNQLEPENPPSMGLSVGWADTYSLYTPGQRLPLKRTLPKGEYCLVSTANPDHTAEGVDINQIRESNEENNARRKPVKINLDKQKIESLPGDCS